MLLRDLEGTSSWPKSLNAGYRSEVNAAACIGNLTILRTALGSEQGNWYDGATFKRVFDTTLYMTAALTGVA